MAHIELAEVTVAFPAPNRRSPKVTAAHPALDASLTWDRPAQLRALTRLPVVMEGLCTSCGPQWLCAAPGRWRNCPTSTSCGR